MENSIEETIQQDRESISKFVSTRAKSSLRSQLLSSLIPALGITLTVAAFWGYRSIQKNTETTINNRLSKEAIVARDLFELSLDRVVKIPLSLASNPVVIQAINQGNRQVIQEKLTDLPIDVLEERYNLTKSLQPNLALNNYLKIVAENNNLSEISLTESSGFNLAYNRPTADFVQRDELWWQNAMTNSQSISEANWEIIDNTDSISSSQKVIDDESGKIIGVVKAVLPISYFEGIATDYLKDTNFIPSQKIQIIDTTSNQPITTIEAAAAIEESTIIGGEKIAKISSLLQNTLSEPQITETELSKQLSADKFIDKVTVKLALPRASFAALKDTATHKAGSLVKKSASGDRNLTNYTVSFSDLNRRYIITSIAKTNFVVVASIDRGEITTVANRLLPYFCLLIAVLFLITTIVIFLTTRQVSKPLQELVIKVGEVASGNFAVRAEPKGTRETVDLAYNFNYLIEQIAQSQAEQAEILQAAETTRQEAEIFAEEQKNKNARIQQELLELLGDVEGASSGDLTVRSRINDGEIGIVADFFNSIIESLRDIVAQVKDAAEQVNVSVGENQQHISELASEASQQADRITQTLVSVEQIGQSIREVARNATEAAEVAHIASNKAERGGESMELTVNSIKQLQTTIDRTAEKVKSLTQASQKISRVISLINQIAIQTNLLSINASIEAARAGDEGKGFAVVAEEVGELATQSSEATKEVSTIIVEIQKEITQVVEGMEVGIVQAEEGTRLVEKTKDSLQQIVEVSYQIDRLVQSISDTTVSQAETSENVTQLMEQIARLSERTSGFSQDASISLESTVEIAKKLQSSVGTFKVELKD